MSGCYINCYIELNVSCQYVVEKNDTKNKDMLDRDYRVKGGSASTYLMIVAKDHGKLIQTVDGGRGGGKVVW